MKIFHKNTTSQSHYSSNTNPTLLTDQNLYELCKTYGSRALEWRRKFTGLLPEVNRRKLYEKKGFSSIFVFAKKLAGLSEQQVRRVLNLEKIFENLPALKSLLVNGEVSLNKLARVASISTTENEISLAQQVKVLFQAAIETLVRDVKFAQKKPAVNSNPVGGDWNQNGLFEPENYRKSVRTHTFSQSNFSESNASTKSIILPNTQTLNLSPEVQQKLIELQQKGFDINQLLLDLLQKRELEIAQKKEQIREKVLQKEGQKKNRETEFEKVQNREEFQDYILQIPSILKTHSRPHLPAAITKIIHEEFGTKCAIRSCHKRAENIHHTLPFALSKTHDPKFLIPLCKSHHELQHSINQKYQNNRAKAMIGGS